MKKTLLTFISIIAFAFTVSAQNVNIPNTFFKAYLLSRTDSINTDSDKNNISKIEANSFKGKINIYGIGGEELIGLEEFTNLTSLICNSGSLLFLDVSKNTKLLRLECGENEISSLDVTHNPLLTYLSCGSNKLKDLDLSNNKLLTYLECAQQSISKLNLSYNTLLKSVRCYTNLITQLDITNVFNLTELFANNNLISEINISNNLELKFFWCYNNQFKSLNVIKNTKLANFQCYDNPNLICIQALNSQIKTHWIKSPTAEYSENCNYTVGINNETILQPKTISNIYNLQGQQVNANTQGLVIIRYADGTSEKVIQ